MGKTFDFFNAFIYYNDALQLHVFSGCAGSAGSAGSANTSAFQAKDIANETF